MNSPSMRIMMTAVAAAALLIAAGVPMATPALAQSAPAATAPLPEAAVRALQEALAKQGISVPRSGVLDAETRVAIRTYQSQHHLPVTGEADKATLDKLGVSVRSDAGPAGPAPTAAPTEGGGTGGGMGMMGQAPTAGGGMGMMGQMPMTGGGMGMVGQMPTTSGSTGMMGQMPMMGGGTGMMGHMPMTGGSGGMGMMGHAPTVGVGPGWIYGTGAAGVPISVDQAKAALERRLASHGNPRLKLGTIRETDLGEILAEIVTRDGSLVQRLAIDRRTGHQRQVD